MIAALLLFGSRARGDFRPKSDVDLLAVTDGGPIKNERLAGGVSLYSYPARLLTQKAASGDLFVLHLIREAIILQDSLNVFQGIAESFEYKRDYLKEIEDAYCIWRFLDARKKLLSRKDVRKRLVWALRTTIIASSAERRRPAFSSIDLARFSGVNDLKDVIDNRNQNDISTLERVSRRVMTKFAADRSLLEWPSDKQSQRNLMLERGGVPADTLRFVQPRLLKVAGTKIIDIREQPVSSSYESSLAE